MGTKDSCLLVFCVFGLNFVFFKSYAVAIENRVMSVSEFCIEGELDPLLEENYKELNTEVCYNKSATNRSLFHRCVSVKETEESSCSYVTVSKLEEAFSPDFFEFIFHQTTDPKMLILSELVDTHDNVRGVTISDILSSLSSQPDYMASDDSYTYEVYDGPAVLVENISDRAEIGSTQYTIMGLEVINGLGIAFHAHRLESKITSKAYVRRIAFVGSDINLKTRILSFNIKVMNKLLTLKNIRKAKILGLIIGVGSPLARGWEIFVEKQNPGVIPILEVDMIPILRGNNQ